MIVQMYEPNPRELSRRDSRRGSGTIASVCLVCLLSALQCTASGQTSNLYLKSYRQGQNVNLLFEMLVTFTHKQVLFLVLLVGVSYVYT